MQLKQRKHTRFTPQLQCLSPYWGRKNRYRRKAFINRQRTCIDLNVLIFACLTLTLLCTFCVTFNLSVLELLLCNKSMNRLHDYNESLLFQIYQQGRICYFRWIKIETGFCDMSDTHSICKNFVALLNYFK